MKKKTWDLYAPIYKRAMKADQKVYDYMYARIPEMIRDKEVLEIATDYSDGMIAEAKKGENPANLTFEVADAVALPYADNSFDAVIIANALHIVPDPKKALNEIDRVLCPGGIMIAPNFVEHKGTLLSRIWSGILRIAGVRFEHQWTSEEYLRFLENNGWKVVHSKEMSARITLMYAECVKCTDADKA